MAVTGMAMAIGTVVTGTAIGAARAGAGAAGAGVGAAPAMAGAGHPVMAACLAAIGGSLIM